MKKTTLTALVTAATIGAVGLTALTPAYAFGPGGKGAQKGPRFNFEEIDANADGKITQDEIAAHRDARFAEQDTNGDGVLSQEELVAAVVEQAQQRASKRIEHMMIEKDANDDGVLSADEMIDGDRASRMFSRLDKDGDGAVTQDEAAEAFAKLRGKREGKGKRWQQNN